MHSNLLISPHLQLLPAAANNDLNELTQQKYWQKQDIACMKQALMLAKQGASLGEVPVGAVLVHNNQIIGEGFNQPITQKDPTCHAEIVALRHACHALKNYRLPMGATLYVTLEPCTMCFGALIHARLSRLVFATHEPRAGVLGSQMNLVNSNFYNHNIVVNSGLYAVQSASMLRSFFKQRRQRDKKKTL